MAITVTEPKKWAVELGATADVNEIPETTDTESGLASMTALFPQLTALPLDAGGQAPQREDFNGLYKLIGQWVRFYMYGGVPSWTSSAAYPAGSLCSYNNSTWTALRASTNIKPAEGAYWHALSNFYTSSLLVADLLNKVYPVGSIYMSVVNISPASFLGGTWQAIEQGRMLMAAGSSWQAGTTGGAAYHALTVQEMPAHDHSATETAAGAHTHGASTGTAGAHAHSGSALEAGAHAHNASTGTAGSHDHASSMGTAGAHDHGGNLRTAGDGGHYHTGTTDGAGNHSHSRGSMNITGYIDMVRRGTTARDEAGGAMYYGASFDTQLKGAGVSDDWGSRIEFNASRSWTGSTSVQGIHAHSFTTSYVGDHTHIFTIKSDGGHYHSLTISKAGDHAHSVTVASNGKHTHNLSIAAAGAHTHSVAIAAAGAHTHAITIGKTGSGAAFSILPPYIAVYMWRRTA